MAARSNSKDSVTVERHSDKPDSNRTSTKARAKERSRSEIEKALSGRTARKPAKSRPAPPSTIDLNVPPRRQQVIGGDLTGVTKHPRSGVLSRYSGIRTMGWVVSAVALMILAAFFWPQDNKPTQEIVGAGVILSPQIGETDLSEDEQLDFLENEGDAGALSFNRGDDNSRAEVFRKQDAQDLKIRSLLDKANAEINNGQYTQPADANATSTYRSILAINPKNIEAKQGLEYITTRFLTSGYSALEQDNPAIAESALSKLDILKRGSDEYLELKAALESWKLQRRISTLLANAQSAYSKRALILPAKANALYFYKQVLLLDGSNQIAASGVQKIADSYIQLANDAVLTAQFDTASAHLATVAIIDATHSSIPLIEAMIARAKPLAELASGTQQSESQEQNSERLESSPDQDTSTPPLQTSEQEAFDIQYLKQGLEAYNGEDYETAAALLQPLADKGIARAQFRLAYMHFLGRGFVRNRQIAESIIRDALPAIQKFADEGRPWAQSDLGNLYEDGLVLSRRYVDAVSWYRAAANQGYPRAQTNLGAMYTRGLGVEADRGIAIEWFQLAAAQGDEVAQLNLDEMGAN